MAEFLRALRGLRSRRGRPHYVLVDEIQGFCPPGGDELADLLLESSEWGGFCFISYRLSQVAPALLARLDHWLMTRLTLDQELDILRPRLSLREGGSAALDQLSALPKGQAYLALGATSRWTPPTQDVIRFRVASRTIPHVRHLHKYLRAPLPVPKQFYFYGGEGRYLGRAAANLWEFREALGEVPAESAVYHLERGDFERWLTAVLHDEELARQVHKLNGRGLKGETLRQALLDVVVQRYEELDRVA